MLSVQVTGIFLNWTSCSDQKPVLPEAAMWMVEVGLSTQQLQIRQQALAYSSTGWSVVLILLVCGFNPQSENMQESTNDCRGR